MIYLFIEFLDELIFGVSEAAWPLIRDELGLTYIQIGLAISLPGFLANFLEPLIFLLGDVWKRRTIILVGGCLFAFSLILTGTSQTFMIFLLSYILYHPASGAFVSLSQASLMDADPERREQNMARWTFAGSVGVVAGPILLGGAAYLGFGWRGLFIGLALISLVILAMARKRISMAEISPSEGLILTKFLKQFSKVGSALRQKHVLRWLVLLEFSDLMLDVLYGFLPLYFVDVLNFTPAQAAFSVAIWSGVGLLGDYLLIPLLERVRGLDYLRFSVWVELILFPIFLTVSVDWFRLVLLGLMGFFNSGWYAILKAKLFDALPDSSGTALALDNVSGFIGKLIPFGIGVAAQNFGLGPSMWLLLAGPIALLVGLPRRALDTRT
ncbi:MAG: MFS transporter [Chloroflexi bacterium]|nr:MFS transporter [Chloroflexota bacterium]